MNRCRRLNRGRQKNNTAIASIVGSLNHTANKSRPELALAASVLGASDAAPTKLNMQQAKSSLKYLNATKELTSVIKSGPSNQLNA